MLGARRQDRIKALADELTRAGGQALAVTTDVTDRAQVKRFVDAAVRVFGRVDAMINNAVPFEGGIRRFDGPQAPKSAK